MRNSVLLTPAATSWMSVLGGWIATIGAMALVAPAVAGILSRANLNGNDIAPAVPVIVGIFVSYLIGGYVAGRMAGYRTSWHGMMTAFFSLFVLLVVALLGYAADRGVFAGSGVNSLADVVPGFSGLSADGIGNALTFGAIIGFLVAIVAGWVGGLLAPTRAYVPATAPWAPRESGPVSERRVGERPVPRRDVVRERRPAAFPAFGRKGGERVVEEREDAEGRVVERREEVERRSPD